jgi:hypothetical protein
MSQAEPERVSDRGLMIEMSGQLLAVTFPPSRPPASQNHPMTSLMPPGDDEFDRGPTAPPDTPGPSYDRDYARAQLDRGSYGPVSAAYWIVRAVQGLFRLFRRRAG